MNSDFHHRRRKEDDDHPPFREVTIRLSQPFDLEQSTECGQAFRWIREGEHYYCVIGERVLRLRQSGNTLHAAVQPDAGYLHTLGLVGDVFRFDDNVYEILEEISEDGIIREAIRSHYGLRLIRQDPWECLISYLCSINSNIPRIKGDVERISRRYGHPMDFYGRRFYTFPSVDALASAGEEELRSMRLGFRAKYVLSASRRIMDEGVDLMGFRKMGYEESFAELCTYFGIGPKVADCILLFSMDKLEAFPVDRWVRRGIEILYFNGQKMTDKKVREWSRSHFGRYAGYAQEYLFYGARLKELATGFTNRTASA